MRCTLRWRAGAVYRGGRMADSAYVHGYSDAEAARLGNQSETLADLLHHDTVFTPGARVLEVGCGVGAQTAVIASRNPAARIVSIELAGESLRVARRRVRERRLGNVLFAQADAFRLPFAEASFDDVFVCFVLEHLVRPLDALRRLHCVLRPGGRLTVVEGDHGSAYFHPRSDAARRTIDCLVEAQAHAGGNALIGRELYPLLGAAGFREVRVSPRVVYADASRPEWVEGFTRRTFIAMVAGARERALELSLIDDATWDAGIADLRRAAEADGTFSYTFFKAHATKEGR
jgi:SAM-dependent methyltransferase